MQVTKAQSIHDRHGSCAHRDDVADNSSHTGGGTLEGFDEAGVIMTLNFEGDSPTFTDVDNPGVFSHSHQQVFRHRRGDFLPKLAQVDFRRLVGAVLAPHDRIHGELAGGGPAPQYFFNQGVLIIFEPQGLVGLVFVGRRCCLCNTVDNHALPHSVGGPTLSNRVIVAAMPTTISTKNPTG